MNLKTLALSIAAIALTACSDSSSNPGSSTPSKIRLSDSDYEKVLSRNETELTQLAQAGQLGVCSVINVGKDYVRGCRTEGQDSWAVFLQDHRRYYPSMNEDSAQDAACLSQVGGNLRQAVREGFCFFNSEGPVK